VKHAAVAETKKPKRMMVQIVTMMKRRKKVAMGEEDPDEDGDGDGVGTFDFSSSDDCLFFVLGVSSFVGTAVLLGFVFLLAGIVGFKRLNRIFKFRF